MQITWVKAKKEFVLQGIKSYIHLELSNAGKCTLDLVMRPDRRILWSRAHISWTLLRQAGSGVAGSLWVAGSGKNQAYTNLRASGVPSSGDWDTFYPVPPTFSHLYLRPTVLSDPADGASCAIVNYYYYFYLFTHNVSKSPGIGTVVFVGQKW